MSETEMPTPRTDEAIVEWTDTLPHGGIPWVPAYIARQLERENAAMREVIKEAEHALEILMQAKRGGMQPANALIDAMFYAADTRKKLQPYLP